MSSYTHRDERGETVMFGVHVEEFDGEKGNSAINQIAVSNTFEHEDGCGYEISFDATTCYGVEISICEDGGDDSEKDDQESDCFDGLEPDHHFEQAEDSDSKAHTIQHPDKDDTCPKRNKSILDLYSDDDSKKDGRSDKDSSSGSDSYYRDDINSHTDKLLLAESSSDEMLRLDNIVYGLSSEEDSEKGLIENRECQSPPICCTNEQQKLPDSEAEETNTTQVPCIELGDKSYDGAQRSLSEKFVTLETTTLLPSSHIHNELPCMLPSRDTPLHCGSYEAQKCDDEYNIDDEECNYLGNYSFDDSSTDCSGEVNAKENEFELTRTDVLSGNARNKYVDESNNPTVQHKSMQQIAQQTCTETVSGIDSEHSQQIFSKGELVLVVDEFLEIEKQPIDHKETKKSPLRKISGVDVPAVGEGHSNEIGGHLTDSVGLPLGPYHASSLDNECPKEVSPATTIHSNTTSPVAHSILDTKQLNATLEPAVITNENQGEGETVTGSASFENRIEAFKNLLFEEIDDEVRSLETNWFDGWDHTVSNKERNESPLLLEAGEPADLDDAIMRSRMSLDCNKRRFNKVNDVGLCNEESSVQQYRETSCLLPEENSEAVFEDAIMKSRLSLDHFAPEKECRQELSFTDPDRPTVLNTELVRSHRVTVFNKKQLFGEEGDDGSEMSLLVTQSFDPTEDKFKAERSPPIQADDIQDERDDKENEHPTPDSSSTFLVRTPIEDTEDHYSEVSSLKTRSFEERGDECSLRTLSLSTKEESCATRNLPIRSPLASRNYNNISSRPLFESKSKIYQKNAMLLSSPAPIKRSSSTKTSTPVPAWKIASRDFMRARESSAKKPCKAAFGHSISTPPTCRGKSVCRSEGRTRSCNQNSFLTPNKSLGRNTRQINDKSPLPEWKIAAANFRADFCYARQNSVNLGNVPKSAFGHGTSDVVAHLVTQDDCRLSKAQQQSIFKREDDMVETFLERMRHGRDQERTNVCVDIPGRTKLTSKEKKRIAKRNDEMVEIFHERMRLGNEMRARDKREKESLQTRS